MKLPLPLLHVWPDPLFIRSAYSSAGMHREEVVIPPWIVIRTAPHNPSRLIPPGALIHPSHWEICNSYYSVVSYIRRQGKSAQSC